MSRTRQDGRRVNELRPLDIQRGYTKACPGSVLIRTGETVVLCTATIEESVPEWMEGKGGGWVTAEYDMLPGSTGRRRSRSRRKVDGRTSEIQRLIGRVCRSVVDMQKLGERCIWLDCDVLQADGGTRTAAITGAYVALADAVNTLKRDKLLTESPLSEPVAAVSVGKVDGRILLDLNYIEDSMAEVDLNVAMTASAKFVEVQGCAEGNPFNRAELDKMLTLAKKGIRELVAGQEKALARRSAATAAKR